jgi:hypothetical protein
MTKFKEVLSLKRGSILLSVLILSLFFFIEAIAAAGDIFLPIVYHDIQTATPTPTLIPGGVVVETDYVSDFTTSAGILHVVGEIRNKTSYTLRNMKVTVNFYNANNQLLESRSAFTYMIDLPAGKKTCFNISLDPPTGWSKYQFAPVTYQTDGNLPPNIGVLNLIGSYDPKFGYYQLTGLIRNDEAVQVSQVRTVGTLYNVTNRVIGCKFYQFPDRLDPGASKSFNIEFRERDYIDTATYRLQVDGDIP